MGATLVNGHSLHGMAEMRLVQAGGIRLAYRESGSPSSAPLLLLHALGENGADWDQVAPGARGGGDPGRPADPRG